MSLMIEEWNIEDALKYNREDAWEQGLECGLEQGLERGLERGRNEGMKDGMVYAYYEMNLKTNEIAKKVNLTEAEVLEIIKKKNI